MNAPAVAVVVAVAVVTVVAAVERLGDESPQLASASATAPATTTPRADVRRTRIPSYNVPATSLVGDPGRIVPTGCASMTVRSGGENTTE